MTESPMISPANPSWKVSLNKALNNGGTRRKKRERNETKRKHVQVATLNQKTGRPTCRTMVFRGFCNVVDDAVTNNIDGDACQKFSINTIPGGGSSSIDGGDDNIALFPMLITDTRSDKFSNPLKYGSSGNNHFCEICWWLDEAGVQFRISVRIF